ncbi:MAG: Lipopolysaccharide assembly protein A domain [Bacteriophage sp.]|nr:MAG: Lipopolysaccharide assembly protein A domain [Bacteriophage sp.]
MIENVSHFILGMIFGLSVYLFIRITIVSKKLDRLIRDINDTQNWIRKKESLMTSLLPFLYGGSPRSVA